MKIYYIYRHTRLDTSEPFYIGLGTCNKKYKKPSKYFDRAYRKSKRDRSVFWHNIVNKTDYIVDIIFQHSDLATIKNKETEFIKLYGRRDLGTGTLVNMSYGHEGNHITPISDNAKKSMYKASIDIAKSGFLSPYGKHVFVYNSSGEFLIEYGSIRECGRLLNIPVNKIQQILHGKGPCYSYKELIFYPEFKGMVIPNPIIGNNKIKKPVGLYDEFGNILKTYIGIKEAADDNQLCIQTIGRLCNTEKISRWGQYFKFVDKNP